ncbi:hypothetical protein EVAR_73782_1 [Eumeta japonica]|uniref:Uncharacterized protein n=1 Tax=Eumeta variegata TaxID=151549 RepID=A0A4C1ZUG7_EUMVA|nr:hypothetical protein EVAR_73782_1 [Eumeta japonica]
MLVRRDGSAHVRPRSRDTNTERLRHLARSGGATSRRLRYRGWLIGGGVQRLVTLARSDQKDTPTMAAVTRRTHAPAPPPALTFTHFVNMPFVFFGRRYAVTMIMVALFCRTSRPRRGDERQTDDERSHKDSFLIFDIQNPKKSNCEITSRLTVLSRQLVDFTSLGKAALSPTRASEATGGRE